MRSRSALWSWGASSLLVTLIALCACDDDADRRAAAEDGDAGLDATDDGADDTADTTPDADTDCRGTLTITDATLPQATACMEQLWVADQAEAACASLARCACPELPDDCVERLARPLREQITEALQSFARETLILDLDALRGCVAALEDDAADCHRERPSLDVQKACFPAVLVDAALGEPCRGRWACADGEGWCDVVLGRCEPLAGPGELCSGGCREGICRNDGTDNRCLLARGEGAACEDDGACDDGLRCIDSVCEAPRAAGLPCVQDRDCAFAHHCEGGRCTATPEPGCTPGTDACGAGGACLVLEGERRCVARALGDACERSDECPAGAFCADGHCAPAAAQGQPCSDGVYCADGLACHFEDFTCQPVPQQGDPCALGVFGPFLCADGLGCLDGVCRPLPTQGQACAIDNRCADDLGCDFQPNGSVCVPRSTEGGPCTNDTVCASDLYCEFSELICRAFVPNGGHCEDGNECGPNGTCAPDGHGDFACTHLPALDEPCFLDCAAGSTCVTTHLVTTCAPKACAAVPPEP